MPGKQKKFLVTKKTSFAEIISKCPEAVPVLAEHGLHCIGCHAAAFETLEQGALMHGLNEKQLKEMIDDINKKSKKE